MTGEVIEVAVTLVLAEGLQGRLITTRADEVVVVVVVPGVWPEEQNVCVVTVIVTPYVVLVVVLQLTELAKVKVCVVPPHGFWHGLEYATPRLFAPLGPQAGQQLTCPVYWQAPPELL